MGVTSWNRTRVEEPDGDFVKARRDFVVVSALLEGETKPRQVHVRLSTVFFNGATVTIAGRYGKDGRDRTLNCSEVVFKDYADAKRLLGGKVNHPCIKIGLDKSAASAA